MEDNNVQYTHTYLVQINNWTDLQLKWFQSHIKNRSFFVNLSNVSSSMAPLNYGLPQGSILSPILFSLFHCACWDPSAVAITSRTTCMQMTPSSIFPLQVNKCRPCCIASTRSKAGFQKTFTSSVRKNLRSYYSVSLRLKRISPMLLPH